MLVFILCIPGRIKMFSQSAASPFFTAVAYIGGFGKQDANLFFEIITSAFVSVGTIPSVFAVVKWPSICADILDNVMIADFPRYGRCMAIKGFGCSFQGNTGIERLLDLDSVT
jgi:hypothetical protein